MRLIERLVEEVRAPAMETPLKGVWVGLSWTVVESRYAGMSHTYKTGRKVTIENEGRLDEEPLFALVERALSWEPLEASIGLAAINSLLAALAAGGSSGSVNPLIERLARGRTVTIIGRFPFNDRVSAIAERAYKLEIDPGPGELPAPAAESVIPASDLLVVTSTALINHTLQRLLELASDCFVILLGPSTPFSPLLFEYGVDILAGVEVHQCDELVRTVTQGAKTFRRLDGVTPRMMVRPGLEERHITAAP